MVRYCALLLAWLAIAVSTTAYAETGSRAGKIQVTLFLDRTEFLPGENVTCEICYYNVSEETLTMARPGGGNYDYLLGQYFRLFDADGQELAPTLLWGAFHFASFPEDDDPLVLAPGEEYCDLADDPALVGHQAHYDLGHYGLQVRLYYYDESMADFAAVPDLKGAMNAWCEAHYKFLDSSNLVWFDRVDELGKAHGPRLWVNNAEIAEARPLRFDGVIYADSRDLSRVGIKVDIDGDKVVASRGEREVTLALGKWNPKRDKLRPALSSGATVYLPVRQVATALGLRVNWDPVRKIADVRS